MRRTGIPGHLRMNRRDGVQSLLAGAAVALCSPARRTLAQSANPVAAQAQDLSRLFPDARELPAGLELENSGTRVEIAQLAGTFRNSRDAAQLLSNWGWVGNAFRSYAPRAGAGSVTPARVEISLHQFTSSTGAAYALAYFAHDRAVALQHHERLGAFLLPCAALVTGDGSATRFLRSGNLVVRVTVVMATSMDAEANATASTTATNLALAVLEHASGEGPDPVVAC